MSFGLALLVLIGVMLAIALYMSISLRVVSKAWEHFGDIGSDVTTFIMVFLPFAVILAWAISSGS